jgi:DNA-binding response OmpR family regulator
MSLPDFAPVLIVEDDDLVRNILCNRLQHLNITALAAASAEEALALMETIRVAVLVLDLHMPGQSGLDLAEFVRLFGAHLTGVPILIFTGATLTPETRELANRYEAEVFLKPDGLNALLQRVAVIADPMSQLVRMERLVTPRSGANSSDTKEPES